MNPKKITYQQMIKMLQADVHTAPDTWSSIENDLDFSEELTGLKTYEAPDLIWNNIEEVLEKEMPQSNTTPKSNSKLWVLSLIAAIGLLTAGYFYNLDKNSSDFVYSSEIEIIENKLPELEDNPEAYSQGVSFIEENEDLFSEEQFTSYEEQLEEMDNAIQKIKMMQEQYGEDDSSIRMLSRLEREKAELLKSMINRT